MPTVNLTLSPEQAEALRLIVVAVKDAVRAAGDHGAPGGVLYAGLMAQGCTLSQFESLMSALVRRRMFRQEGDLYFLAA